MSCKHPAVAECLVVAEDCQEGDGGLGRGGGAPGELDGRTHTAGVGIAKQPMIIALDARIF